MVWKAAVVSVLLTGAAVFWLTETSTDNQSSPLRRAATSKTPRETHVSNSGGFTTDELLAAHAALVLPKKWTDTPLPKISMVYLYVNGSDPVVSGQRVRFGGTAKGTACFPCCAASAL